MADVIWKAEVADGALVAAAIHNGHDVRPEVAAEFALSEPDRRREEDPYTAEWTAVGPTRIVGLRSRFEVDLNRPREKAVYRRPEDAWGLRVWRGELPEEVVRESLAEYDAFYSEVRQILSGIEQRHGRFVVLDLHTYNHRREGPEAAPADPVKNPEVNVGTGTMNRNLWSPVVDRFLSDLRAFDFDGRRLDVRENVKFQGGELSRWIHDTFPASGCSLAIEFKKMFMDEWTGELFVEHHRRILAALQSTVAGVLEELETIPPR